MCHISDLDLIPHCDIQDDSGIDERNIPIKLSPFQGDFSENGLSSPSLSNSDDSLKEFFRLPDAQDVTNGKSMKESIEEYGKQQQTGNSAIGYVHNILKKTAYVKEVEKKDEAEFMESFIEMKVNALVDAEKRR